MIQLSKIAVLIAVAATNDVAVSSESDVLLVKLESLRHQPLITAESGYAEIIIESHADPNLVSTFFSACRRLSRRVFREECLDYGYTCPEPGADIWHWPAKIDERTAAQLQSNVPALRQCPVNFILDFELPVVRFPMTVSCEMVEKEAYGWVTVDLTLDNDGKVKNASVNESTSELLNSSAIQYARQLRYRKQFPESRVQEDRKVRTVVHFDQDAVKDSNKCKDLDSGS
jgi:TonB family protein